MNEDRLLEPVTLSNHEVTTIRSPSRLEVLTTADAEPVLKAMLNCLERLDERVRIVLKRDGSVLASGSGLDAWFERSQCLALHGDRLKATTRDGQIKLDRLFRVPETEIQTVILERKQSDGHCIIRGAGLCTETLAVTIQLADDHFEPQLADLRDAFGLTPSELLIVEMLQLGHGANEIGKGLGISVHTVRAHLRHCYDKLGVSSREELWQKLAPYRLN